jgi:Ca2+/H+ antiporter
VGIAGAIVVGLTVAAALTLLPAILAILAAFQVTSEGESNWFEGAQLLALYAVLAAVFFVA